MTQILANNINNIFKYREKIFVFLLSGIVITLCMYVYLLQLAITNVVAREDIVKQNRTISTEVSELEAKYFVVKNTINIELAHQKGFEDSKNTTFISKKSLTAMAEHHEL